MADSDDSSPVARSIERRKFLGSAAAGTIVVALGGLAYVLARDDDPRSNERLPDGRFRLPPGQRLLRGLRAMGGEPGDPNPANFTLVVHGEVERTLRIGFADLLRMPQTEQRCDVHCVTGWSMFDSRWTGVQIAHLARLAGVHASARYVIFESAHGYTANVPLDEALRPNVLVAHRFDGDPLPRPNGPPVRALVPHLYFWKSAKWLSGIRFLSEDRPGYWETRGYHNHADPWTEERYG